MLCPYYIHTHTPQTAMQSTTKTAVPPTACSLDGSVPPQNPNPNLQQVSRTATPSARHNISKGSQLRVELSPYLVPLWVNIQDAFGHFHANKVSNAQALVTFQFSRTHPIFQRRLIYQLFYRTTKIFLNKPLFSNETRGNKPLRRSLPGTCYSSVCFGEPLDSLK